ncbi:hypothetical protein [Spirosoma jeollabukense]
MVTALMDIIAPLWWSALRLLFVHGIIHHDIMVVAPMLVVALEALVVVITVAVVVRADQDSQLNTVNRSGTGSMSRYFLFNGLVGNESTKYPKTLRSHRT